MSAFTLRLDDHLTKSLEKICAQKGYSKTGLVKSLIRDFISKNTEALSTNPKSNKASLVGMIRLGGDSVRDSENIFE